MNTLNKDNIFNFFLETQCCLATKGLEMARKLSVDNVCYEDKVSFILSHIFKKILRVYNEGDLPTSLTVLTNNNVSFDYIVNDIYINSVLVWSGTLQFSGTFGTLIKQISDKINTNELYNSSVTTGDDILLLIQSLNYLDSQETQTISFGSYYEDGSPITYTIDISSTYDV